MLLDFFTKTDVKKNLTISIIGVGIGQLVHLLITPAISRIYTPEQFGEFSLFLSIMGIISSISLMKFDLAIITCKDDEVNSIYQIIQRICLCLFFLLLGIVFILYLLEHQYLKIFAFSTIAVLVFNQFWSLRAILNKSSKFKILATSKILENSVNGVVTIATGLLSLKEIGLFIGKIFGMLSSVILYKIHSKDLYPKTPQKLSSIIKKYNKFPKYSFPAEIVSNLNFNTSIFLFTYFFSSIEVGFIGLTTRVLSVPVNFVSISFLDVFKQKAVEDFESSKKFDTIFLKFLALLSLLAILMILIIFFTGPTLFDFFFGNEWIKAGIYAKYICILYALRFVNYPLSFSFEVTGKNYINLYFQTIYLVVGTIAIIGTYLITQDDVLCVSVYSLSLSVIYLVHIFMAYLNSKQS